MAGDGGKGGDRGNGGGGNGGGGNGGWVDEPWEGDVEYWDRDALAYRPGRILVPEVNGAEAEEVIQRRQPSRTGGRNQLPNSAFSVVHEVGDPMSVVGELRARGILAQPDHVLFSHCLCCGCGPHPSMVWPNPHAWLSAYPFGANPFGANPFGANPFGANPFGANPFWANPYGPFGPLPEAAGDVEVNPARIVSYGGAGPETAEYRASGLSHSARTATAPKLTSLPILTTAVAGGTPSIVVVDTGIATWGKDGFRPASLAHVGGFDPPQGSNLPGSAEVPDELLPAGLDPVAGHGTFIAGLIDRIAPGSALEVNGLLTGKGEATEVQIAATLDLLRTRPTEDGGPPALVSLSFGAYTAVDMGCLAEAVRKLQEAGTVVVASAGNDATCRPSYPAAFPGVVAVGALGPHGPAHFTNYGPWVRACAPGVDVVSTFFTGWTPGPGDKPLDEWVRWSGTSFAAPAVVGALARAMQHGIPDAREAVRRVIDDPGLFRIPGLGTVVNQTPWFVRT